MWCNFFGNPELGLFFATVFPVDLELVPLTRSIGLEHGQDGSVLDATKLCQVSWVEKQTHNFQPW